jgi:hypothetical protein
MVWLLALFAFFSLAADTKRVPWLTSKVKGRPDQKENYQTKAVHPNLKFQNPVELVAMPGSDLMWMMELRGAIYAFFKQEIRCGKT